MDTPLSRTSTNGSSDEQRIDGGPLSAIYSSSSVGSNKNASSTSTGPPRLGPRAPSAHSLLGGGNPADLRRKPQTETDKINTERASISMPPPSSKPTADRRLSASMNSYRPPRKSDDGPRSSPTSIKSMDDKRPFVSSPSTLVSTTATDSIHVTTASSGATSASGLPVLSPPAISEEPPNLLDLVSANSNSQVSTSGPAPKVDSTASTLKPELPMEGGALPTRAARVNNPRSVSSSRRLSTPSQKSVDVPDTDSQKLIGTIGVCALDVKARSKPSRQILTRLQAEGEFEVIVFGDKAILDEDVANWPVCDFLIAFFSDGFPLEKAIDYVKLRKPFVVNDLPMQRVLWDRRICLRILDQMQVPTPKRLEVNRDGGPTVGSAEMAQHMRKMSGVVLPGENGIGGALTPPASVYMEDYDTLVVDGKTIKKPFVEKPVSGEDHNIIIYFPSSSDGGGGRRLFRKIGNKSSEFDPKLTTPRCITEPDGSFIYEQFLKTENAEDVKAYTVGHDYCHAETRKSPVVDGLVKRNTHGKEVRYVTHLNATERDMASRVSRGFGQRICGFDLLRANDRSFVIDVNGWSFVKDNETYYSDCAKILKTMFYHEKIKRDSLDDASSDGHPDTSATRRDTVTNAGHSHRQALKGIFKSPSISKLSSHLPSRHHQHGASSPKAASGTTPISSPPTLERSIGSITAGSKISEPESLLPPPIVAPPDPAVDSPSSLTNSEVKETPAPLPNSKHSWKLKGVVAVIRHADRTPKQKIKMTAHSAPFAELLKGHTDEVLLKGEAALASVEAAIKTAQRENLEDQEKLRNLRNTLARKRSHPSTKVQIKPMFRKRRAEEMLLDSAQAPPEASIPEHAEALAPQSPMSPPPVDELHKTTSRKDSLSGTTFSRYSAKENDLVLDKLQLVLKWGGENTHAARYQAQDLGSNQRQDYSLLNKKVLQDVRIFSSSEKRVKTSAQIWATAFLGRDDVDENEITVRKDLLDDSNAAKDAMDKVKKKLKHLLREGSSVPEEFAWPKDVPEPAAVMARLIDLLHFHRRVLRSNFKRLSSSSATASLIAIDAPDSKPGGNQRELIDVNSIQARWCTGEDAIMFRDRYEKLFADFCDSKVDPSKVSELYDALKYDALHHKQFLEWVFTPSQSIIDQIALEEATDSQLASPESEKNNPTPGDRQGTNTTLSPNDRNSFAEKMGFRRRSVLAQAPSTPPSTSSDGSQYFKLYQGNSEKKENQDSRLGPLREMYRLSKVLFDYLAPQEYGISPSEKLEIGLLTSCKSRFSTRSIFMHRHAMRRRYCRFDVLGLALPMLPWRLPIPCRSSPPPFDSQLMRLVPLLREIVADLEDLQAASSEKEGDGKESTYVYFTKESHIYTLLNCIVEGDIPLRIKRAAIPEMDFLSSLTFELFESKDHLTRESAYSIRISISPGCHVLDPLSLTLDSRHCINSAPRRSLTDHQDWKTVLSALRSKFGTVQLPASFLAVNVSDQHEKDAQGGGEHLQEDDSQVNMQTKTTDEAGPEVTDA